MDPEENHRSPARRWGSSVRGSLRQWALSSVSTLSVSTTTAQEEWFCERCTYRNAATNNHTCALCGWNRVTLTVERNNNNSLSPAQAPPVPEFPVGEDSENDSSSMMQTSNSGHNVDDFDVSRSGTRSYGTGPSLADTSFDAQYSTVVSTGVSFEGTDPSLRDLALTTIDTTLDSTASTQCSSHWWDDHEVAIIETQGGGLCSKQYCKRCSNRVALVWLILLLSLVTGVTLLAVVVKDKRSINDQASSSAGSATGGVSTDPSPTQFPTTSPNAPFPSPDPPIETSQPPTPLPTEQTEAPSTSPSLSPTESPSEFPSKSPSLAPSNSPSHALTFIPSLPNSVSFAQLGDGIFGGSGVGKSFGDVISLTEDGRTIAISGPQLKFNFQDQPGVVKVFKLFQDGWQQLGSDLFGEGNRDAFGKAVSLSESDGGVLTLAVGGPGNDSEGQDTGHVMVYRYSLTSDEWEPFGTDIRGADFGKAFGLSTSLAGNGKIVAVGAKGYAEVYKFDDQQNDWTPFGNSLINSGENGNRWKVSLSENGRTLALGAPGPSSGGYVRVYDNDDEGNWIQRGHISDDIGFDYQGSCISVSISSDGDIVAVRATTVDEDLTKVFAYNRATGEWERRGEPIYWTWPFNFWAWLGLASLDCAEYSQSLILSSNGQVVGINADGGPVLLWYNSQTNTWEEIEDENGRRIYGDTVSLSGSGRVVAVSEESNNRVDVIELQ